MTHNSYYKLYCHKNVILKMIKHLGGDKKKLFQFKTRCVMPWNMEFECTPILI